MRCSRDGIADLVSFAALFLANPDLPERLRRGGPFNPPDRKTFYGGDGRGYTDYPALPVERRSLLVASGVKFTNISIIL